MWHILLQNSLYTFCITNLLRKFHTHKHHRGEIYIKRGYTTLLYIRTDTPTPHLKAKLRNSENKTILLCFLAQKIEIIYRGKNLTWYQNLHYFLLIVFICWTDVILCFEYVLKYRKKSTVLMIVSYLPGNRFQGN